MTIPKDPPEDQLELSLKKENTTNPPDTQKNSITNPHDAFFKNMMGDVRMARRFLDVYLPKQIRSRCDFSTLKLQPGDFVESDLRQHLTDVLYSVKINGQTGYVQCLIEHVSYAKRLTAFQVLRYQIAAMHQAIKQGAKRPPIVIPLVFYRGKRSPYPFSCDVFDCFEDSQLARETLLNPHLLIDLSVIPDEELAAHQEIAMMELLQKHAHTRDMVKLIQYVSNCALRKYLTSGQFESAVNYAYRASHSKNRKAFKEQFDCNTHLSGDKTMMQTFSETLRQEGMQQGKYQTQYAIAKNLLLANLSIEKIAEATGLSQEEVEKLSPVTSD